MSVVLDEQRSIPRLLLGLSSHSITGRAQVHDPSGCQTTVFLRRGAPVHAVSSDDRDRLDRFLVQTGLIAPEEMARAEEHRERTGALLGQALRELGLLDASKLNEALRQQLRRKVTRLFASDHGTMSVLVVEHPFGAGDSSPGAPIEARTLVLPAIRANYDEARLGRELRHLTGRVLRLVAVQGATLSELGFRSSDAPFLKALRHSGVRVDQSWLATHQGTEPKSALLSLYHLHLLEFADTVEASTPPSITSRPPANANVSMLAPPSARSPRILVAPAAGRTTVSVAEQVLLTTAPRPASSAPPLRDDPASPSSQEWAARPRTSGSLPSPLPSPAAEFAGTPRTIGGGTTAAEQEFAASPHSKLGQRLVGLPAEHLVTMAEGYFRNGEVSRAEEVFELAKKTDPENVHCRAFLAWINLWKTSSPSQAALAEALATFRRAIAADQRFAYGYYFVGELLRVQNELGKAQSMLKLALSHDPKLFDAQRALRLISMRASKRSG